VETHEYLARHRFEPFRRLTSGETVPTVIEDVVIRDGNKRRRGLRLPDGTIYTRHKGLWVHTIIAYADMAESPR